MLVVVVVLCKSIAYLWLNATRNPSGLPQPMPMPSCGGPQLAVMGGRCVQWPWLLVTAERDYDVAEACAGVGCGKMNLETFSKQLQTNYAQFSCFNLLEYYV